MLLLLNIRRVLHENFIFQAGGDGLFKGVRARSRVAKTALSRGLMLVSVSHFSNTKPYTSDFGMKARVDGLC